MWNRPLSPKNPFPAFSKEQGSTQRTGEICTGHFCCLSCDSEATTTIPRADNLPGGQRPYLQPRCSGTSVNKREMVVVVLSLPCKETSFTASSRFHSRSLAGEWMDPYLTFCMPFQNAGGFWQPLTSAEINEAGGFFVYHSWESSC